MHTDILIVGGGLSGLALADHLTRQEADFLLVEAQDRLGGRILTRDVSGGQFDLGPAWFWHGQPRMAALARRFDIPVFEQFSTGDLMFQDSSGNVQRGRGFVSMQGSNRLVGGMGSLIRAFSAVLDPARVTTGAPLVSVGHGSDGIVATFERAGETFTISARRIVLAIPPRVIADTIRFDPVLSAEQLQSLENVPTWMAGQAKIVAVYDEPHWRNAGLSGDAMSQVGPMVEIHDASPKEGGPFALFGFVGVPAQVRAAHKDALMDRALVQFTELFGPEMARPKALLLQDWATVPEIARAKDQRPTSHHPFYGQHHALRRLADRGVLFGGTEMAQGFGGFLEGALESAEKVNASLALPTRTSV